MWHTERTNEKNRVGLGAECRKWRCDPEINLGIPAQYFRNEREIFNFWGNENHSIRVERRREHSTQRIVGQVKKTLEERIEKFDTI